MTKCNDKLSRALRDLLALAEQYCVNEDAEYNAGRTLAEIESDGSLPPEIMAAREALKECGS